METRSRLPGGVSKRRRLAKGNRATLIFCKASYEWEMPYKALRENQSPVRLAEISLQRVVSKLCIPLAALRDRETLCTETVLQMRRVTIQQRACESEPRLNTKLAITEPLGGRLPSAVDVRSAFEENKPITCSLLLYFYPWRRERFGFSTSGTNASWGVFVAKQRKLRPATVIRVTHEGSERQSNTTFPS